LKKKPILQTTNFKSDEKEVNDTEIKKLLMEQISVSRKIQRQHILFSTWKNTMIGMCSILISNNITVTIGLNNDFNLQILVRFGHYREPIIFRFDEFIEFITKPNCSHLVSCIMQIHECIQCSEMMDSSHFKTNVQFSSHIAKDHYLLKKLVVEYHPPKESVEETVFRPNTENLSIKEDKNSYHFDLYEARTLHHFRDYFISVGRQIYEKRETYIKFFKWFVKAVLHKKLRDKDFSSADFEKIRRRCPLVRAFSRDINVHKTFAEMTIMYNQEFNRLMVS
jgi:hypothetical protein